MDASQFAHFKWLNPGRASFEAGRLVIEAPGGSDFFCNNGAVAQSGLTPASTCNAPFFHTQVSGDFVMRVQVSHDFQDTYDAAAIMVMRDLQVWAKACFEKTDFGTHAAVSVVTNLNSDDANGPNLDGNSAWLQVARVGDSFAFHYSLDGQGFYMMRFFNLPVGPVVQAGLVAQAPTGKGGRRYFENFSLEHRTVKNIRFGE
jgi:regulation of enolase protein 1 (concanavalin A-like superfamily)